MRRLFCALVAISATTLVADSASAAGLLIEANGSTALAMRQHKVNVKIDGQVAVTHVEQVFHNHTDRQLEATYMFPVPKGANVNKFSMWVDGKEVKGELVEADQAREIYTGIVRKLQDPGLLEYVGQNLLKLRVFPVPARGDQKIALSYTAINNLDAGLIEYTYPLKADAKAAQSMEKFSLSVSMKADHAVQNVYSPTHQVKITHKGDKKCEVHFEKDKIDLDKDFQLYYSIGGKDVGLSAVTHRPVGSEPGHFMMLISPRAELGQQQHVSRDLVFVMDTSGSMAGEKLVQAKKALKFCLQALNDKDRFTMLNFATTVNHFSTELKDVSKDNVAKARTWVDELQPTGGTAIDAALQAALDLRPKGTERPFTVVFFTDGEATVDVTDPKAILKNVTNRNSDHTRIFTFGVGHDVNATLLDKLADETRAVSTYVKPEEDIEAKVSALYAKISHPVLTELKLAFGEGVKVSESYPPKLPDLFHGGQVVVLGRYTGEGSVAVTLTGKVGDETREFVQEAKFSQKTNDDRAFVEGLWARRKVGYLLDNIREGGEKKELVEEVVKLAKKHGITTPYTSYLVVPDGVQRPTSPPGAVTQSQPVMISQIPQSNLTDYYQSRGYNINNPTMPGHVFAPSSGPVPAPMPAAAAPKQPVAIPGFQSYDTSLGSNSGTFQSSQNQFYAPAAPTYTQNAPLPPVSTPQPQSIASNGQAGVYFAETLSELRTQTQVPTGQSKQANGQSFAQVNGVWAQSDHESKKADVTIKALSKAYFRLLEVRPELADVFRLGKDLLFVTPTGKVVAVSAKEGSESLTDSEIEALFGK